MIPNKESQIPCRDLNSGPPEHETEMLPTRPENVLRIHECTVHRPVHTESPVTRVAFMVLFQQVLNSNVSTHK
jgi:hypothetical protein